MVRIVGTPGRKPAINATIFNDGEQALLSLMGAILSEEQAGIINLLNEYSIVLSTNVPAEQLIRALINALGEEDQEFNQELATLIWKAVQKSDFDDFNLGGLLGGKQQGEGNPQALPNLTQALGNIGSAIGSAIQGKQAREQATSRSLQSLLNYRQQQLAENKSSSKNKMFLLIGLMVLLGLGFVAMAISINRNTSPLNA